MSAFYDLASVVLVPSGYKSGKIYAQKPLTTDGQLTFTRASTATRVNASGLIETVASGVPRLDYLGSSCPKLQLEPQRTNVAQFSEQFNNAAWISAEITITANNTNSPDGYVNADKVVSNTNNALHFIGPALTSFVSGTAYTSSVFVKKDTGRYFQLLYGSGGFGFTQYANFDLQLGTVTFQGAAASAKIDNFGNGWYRCAITSTATQNFSDSCYSAIITSGTAARAENHSTALSYWVYGYQIEAGAYATSYIPTLGTSVTRVWDDASKTGITSLIGQTAGTLFVELNADGRPNSIARVIAYLTENGSTDNRVAIQYNASGQIQAIASSGGSTQGSVAYTITGPCKAAFAYNSSGYELFVNGVSRGTFTGSLPTSLTRLDMNSLTGTFDELGGTINQVLIFKNRLSNSDLATLTTL
jgi:hypothetical protein